MVFFMDITNIWKNVSTLLVHGFFLEIFKIHRLVWTFKWIFRFFECVSSIFCLKLLLILNFTDAVFFIKHDLLGPVDLKIFGLERTHDCDLTANKVFRLLPKLYLWLPSLKLLVYWASLVASLRPVLRKTDLHSEHDEEGCSPSVSVRHVTEHHVPCVAAIFNRQTEKHSENLSQNYFFLQAI